MLPGGLALCTRTKYAVVPARRITMIIPERRGHPPQVNWEFCLWILGSRPDFLPADALMSFLSRSAAFWHKQLANPKGPILLPLKSIRVLPSVSMGSRTQSCSPWGQQGWGFLCVRKVALTPQNGPKLYWLSGFKAPHQNRIKGKGESAVWESEFRAASVGGAQRGRRSSAVAKAAVAQPSYGKLLGGKERRNSPWTSHFICSFYSKPSSHSFIKNKENIDRRNYCHIYTHRVIDSPSSPRLLFPLLRYRVGVCFCNTAGKSQFIVHMFVLHLIKNIPIFSDKLC